AEDGKAEGLPSLESVCDWSGLQISSIGNCNINTNRDQRARPKAGLTMNDRRSIAIIDNAVERDVAQPSCRLAGRVDQPRPVIVVIDVDIAVRLDERAGGNQHVVDAAPMNFLAAPNQSIEMLGEPLTIAMASPCI